MTSADPRRFLQFRCSAELRLDVEMISAACDMQMGPWLRAVIQGAVDQYKADMEAEAVPDVEEYPDEYVERVEADAEALRQELAKIEAVEVTEEEPEPQNAASAAPVRRMPPRMPPPRRISGALPIRRARGW